MNDPKRFFFDLVHDESGQDLVEYALLAGIVGLGAIASLKSVAGGVNAIFTAVGARLSAAI